MTLLVLTYLLFAVFAFRFLLPDALAGAWPTPPGWWLRQAACIRSHEGSWRLVNPPYAGAYQFTLSTWNANHGHARTLSDIRAATPAEQTYRAWLNWLANGHRWGLNQWPTSSRLCGLR